MADHSLALRGAIVAALKGHAGVVGLVPADRILADQPADPPAWPWIRVAPPIFTPDEMQGFTGGEYAARVHVFADDSTAALRINRQVNLALDETRPALDLEEVTPGADAHVVQLTSDRSEVVPDSGRAGAYHGICDFSATTAEER